MKGDVLNSEIQLRLEEAVLNYQETVKTGNSFDIEAAYKKITNLYNPLDFYNAWYDQYYYLFDSQDDFVADYLRVFATVLLGWKPRTQRNKSRYEGSGEFKNYFIGSLYHNYINMVKSEQAAKRNITKQCPMCLDWVNPLSTHIITHHSNLLWQYLEELDIDLESLTTCPICTNFKQPKAKISKEERIKLLKAHFISKHTPLLFFKFNELYPDVSTISPKNSSTSVYEQDDELDLYEVIEGQESLIDKLSLLDLTELQKMFIDQILNGETNLVYKPDKYKCTKEEWELEMEALRETMSIYGYGNDY